MPTCTLEVCFCTRNLQHTKFLRHNHKHYMCIANNQHVLYISTHPHSVCTGSLVMLRYTINTSHTRRHPHTNLTCRVANVCKCNNIWLATFVSSSHARTQTSTCKYERLQYLHMQTFTHLVYIQHACDRVTWLRCYYKNAYAFTCMFLG